MIRNLIYRVSQQKVYLKTEVTEHCGQMMFSHLTKIYIQQKKFCMFLGNHSLDVALYCITFCFWQAWTLGAI